MLLTKIHKPKANQNLVQRPVLFEKLNKGLKCKLILVSASAGFGKTTIISDWLSHNQILASWFSIDSNDNDIVDFFTYIIYGIQGIKAEFGKSALELLKSPTPPTAESVINLLINDMMDIRKDLLIILDDFHLINNTEILKAVSYLLEYIPENIHLTILSRSDPNLPLAKLRSQQQVVELRTSDLSFSANDIFTLFNKRLKIKLSQEDIKSLETKTEGWIAGLQLAALSLKSSKDVSAFIDAFAGNNRYIMDYLIEEVLKVQSNELKDFLLKTSILDQCSSSLCNAVLNIDNSQAILEKLEKNNMFVFPLDEERLWFRYHHLFADLLKQRLLQGNKSIVKEIHTKACNWFEKNNLYELAIKHALISQNFEKALQLLEETVEHMWQNGLHEAILNYGDELPDDLIKKKPNFCLYYSWILIAAGKIQKAAPFLLHAEEVTRAIINADNSSKERKSYSKKLLGKIAVALAYSNSHEEHSDKSFDYCKIAMKYLSKEDPLWYSWAWFSYGISYFSKGDLLKSKDAFDLALEYGKKSENIYLISTIAIRLAEIEQQLGNYTIAYQKCADLINLIELRGYSQITKAEWTYAALYFIMGATHYMWAELEPAYEKIKTAYNLSLGGKDVFLKIFILMVYVVIEKEHGNPEQTKRIAELEKLMNEIDAPPFLAYMYIGWRIFLFMVDKQFDKAEYFFKEQGLAPENEKTYANETAYAAYARLLIAQNRLDEAETLLSDLHPMALNGKRIERIIDHKILFAAVHNKRGQKQQAACFLIEAMELAAKENLLSFFLYNHTLLDNLLSEVLKNLATTKTNISRKFLNNLQRLEKEKVIKKKPQSLNELSTRELDTLKLMANDLSNQQIADKLFISQNTVKTHLKNINLKLETDSRTKAVAKGRKSGLI